MTIAQQVRDDFINARKTISVSALAKAAGGHQDKKHNCISWHFPDNSDLQTIGTGRSHKISADGEPYQLTTELKARR